MSHDAPSWVVDLEAWYAACQEVNTALGVPQDEGLLKEAAKLSKKPSRAKPAPSMTDAEITILYRCS